MTPRPGFLKNKTDKTLSRLTNKKREDPIKQNEK